LLFFTLMGWALFIYRPEFPQAVTIELTTTTTTDIYSARRTDGTVPKWANEHFRLKGIRDGRVVYWQADVTLEGNLLVKSKQYEPSGQVYYYTYQSLPATMYSFLLE